MTSGRFSEAADLGPAKLGPPTPEECSRLAEAIVAMRPWSDLGTSVETMTRFLADADGGARRYAIAVDGVAAGAASVRSPWLKGPYVELLVVLPDFQAQGIGTAFLRWFESEAIRLAARNLWVCASRSNAGALRFYARHGFEEVVALPDLVAEGADEILLRKVPSGPA